MLNRTSSSNDYSSFTTLISEKPSGVKCTSRIRLLPSLVTLTCLALLAFGARSLVALSKGPPDPASAQHQHSASPYQPTENLFGSQDEPTERMEFVVITVTPSGFEPYEIERPRSAFVLAVHNHSGIAELSLRLHRINSEKLHEIQMKRGRRSWQLPLNLPPGDYVLSEASQREWRCRIKLTN